MALQVDDVRVTPDLAKVAAYKVKLYTLPVVVFVTVVNYLDRGNIAYAADDLQHLLGLSSAGYGAVAGALFYTYVLFQWPHSYIANMVGLRQWLSFLVLLWGCSTVATAFVTMTVQLVLLRLIVGFAEAGSFPLIYMHLDSFLPDEDVAFCWSIIIASSQISSIFSGPLAAGLIAIPAGGLRGSWQWLFLLEGALAMLCALVVFFFLMESPEETRLLNQGEKEALLARKSASSKQRDLAKGARDWKAWYFGCMSFLTATPVYAFMFFSPKLIHSILGPNTSASAVDALNGVPYLMGTIGMLLVGITIKMTGDRLYHGLVGMSLATILAFSFPATFEAGQDVGTFVQLSFLYGIAAALYIPLDTMPSAYCKNPAGSYAIVNSVKSISGIVGPILFGAVKESSDGPSAVAVLGICEVLGMVMTAMFFFIVREARSELSCSKKAAREALPRKQVDIEDDCSERVV